MNEEMIALIRKHCATLRAEFAEADAHFRSLEVGAQPQQINMLTAQAHKIKGSSGTLGFGEISRRAELYEHTLRSAESRSLGEATMASLRHMHAQLGNIIASIAPEQSTLYQRLLGRAAQ